MLQWPRSRWLGGADLQGALSAQQRRRNSGVPSIVVLHRLRWSHDMSSFNWSAIDWTSLIALSVFVLLVARLGERLSFGNRGVGALITALLFALGFAAWSYALHDTVIQAFATILPARAG